MTDLPRLDYHAPNLDLDWLRTQGEVPTACANEIAILRKRLLRYRRTVPDVDLQELLGKCRRMEILMRDEARGDNAVLEKRADDWRRWGDAVEAIL